MCPGDEGEGVYVVELLNGEEMKSSVGGRMGLTSLDWIRLTSWATLPPNNHPAPLGLTAQFSTSSGSLHIKSISSSAVIRFGWKLGAMEWNPHRKTLPRAGSPGLVKVLLFDLMSGYLGRVHRVRRVFLRLLSNNVVC